MPEEIAEQQSTPENKADGIESLPESWQKTIKDLRAENGGLRTRNKEVEQKYSEAGELLKTANEKLDAFTKLQDEHEKALTDVESARTQYGRLKAALDAGIPQMADRLKGDSEEQWTEDAKSLASQLNVNRSATGFNDTSQGQGSEVGLNSDALTEGIARALGVV